MNTNTDYARGLSLETPSNELPEKLNATVIHHTVNKIVDPKKKSNFHVRPRVQKKKTLGESIQSPKRRAGITGRSVNHGHVLNSNMASSKYTSTGRENS